ncbi:MAG: ribonuclease R [Ignavibacteria bacterium]|jgi:ribonuclease R|nr:ribonuclease R [Ignavibacteria bacterium]
MQLEEQIIEILTSATDLVRLLDISKALHIKSDTPEYDELVATLNSLAEDGIIERHSRRRFSISEVPQAKQTQTFANGIIGILHLAENSGIVETEDADYPSIVIPNKLLNTALDGDEVRVKLILQKQKKTPRGEIIDVVNRNNRTIAGTVEFDGDFYFLVPDNDSLDIDFLIPMKDLLGARNGDKAIAEFVRWDNPNKNPQVRILEIIGRAGEPVVEYETILIEYGLVEAFPNDVLHEIKNVKQPNNKEVPDRLDLRNEAVITIDPVTARDFDDALSLQQLENGNYQIGVHIADVSYYVGEGTALDKEAYRRGNSVYLVDRVVPMLPEKLSNEICSLNPDVVRYTFTVLMELDDNLEVVAYNITPSMIKSCRRFDYDEVQDIIDTGVGDCAELVLSLHNLTKRIREKRIATGSINYDTKEIKYILGNDKYPIDVEIHKTTESTALVEECMLLANKTVAIHIKKISKQMGLSDTLPFLYRIHDKPKEESLVAAFDFIKLLGYNVSKNNITPASINAILDEVRWTPYNSVVNQVLIRSMAKAVYSPINIGHYGLGFSYYSHFTSPIRRYPDLVVHRLLREYATSKPDAKRIHQLTSMLPKVAEHTTQTERTAMEAERASNKLAAVIYASSMVGEVFEGTITGVVQYGVFVLLDSIYCEGLLHTRDMKDDYYQFDEKRMRITGRHTKQTYSLGGNVRVKITKVSMDKRVIDLEMVV